MMGVALVFSSCFKDLDSIPLDPKEVTSAVVFDNPTAYKQALAKLYAGLAVSGQEGPHGQNDISGLDEGFSPYVRQYWMAQELTTDEAIIAWNDGNIHDYHNQKWDSQNEFIGAMYNRIFFQVSQCNEFLRQTTKAKLDERGVNDNLRAEIDVYRAEARFLRALSYYHALDFFRNVPFVTEEDQVGAFFPNQTNADALFKFIEAEIKDIEGKLKDPGAGEYGRANKAAAWTLLAKMYLNGQVYLGKPFFTEAIDYCKKVIAAGFTLEPNYANLYTADNHKAKGIIFPVNFDGLYTRTWGGMTFIIHASVGGSMSPAAFGIDSGWGGLRTTSAFVNKFPAVGGGTVIVAPNAGKTYPYLYVPGGYQGWNPADAKTVLSSPGNDKKFEGYLYFKDANTEFKFCVNPNWDLNYGDNGANGSLEQNGDNIKVAAAGFYKINVDLNTLKYTIQKTEWGIIGDATANGWDSDQNMTYNATDNAWVIETNFKAGEIKFRANDGWDLNYGDNGPDGILEGGGANIKLPGAGQYRIKLFLSRPDYTYSIERTSFDFRAMFYTSGQSKEIDDYSQFTEGFAITKFTNKTSTGANGSHPTFVDTDFPMFRIEDVYLMYAEAVLRGGTGGSRAQALQYVNAIRARGYKNTGGQITDAELTLDFLLDERARELYWEGHRRTDLIRYGRFSETTYLWPWKGGVKAGRSVDKKFDIFPIPSSDVGANPNLKQNPGY
jgi:hypothetical protein